ncbi:MAG: hypothetical protein IJU61_05995 [Victivallales bacterium]|nr:hypothetical protein [Bacteroidales bacterium]MBQ9446125.1 hypothetical protein [Victivallales bacterium]
MSELYCLAKESNETHRAANLISKDISKPQRCGFCIMSKYSNEPEKDCIAKDDKECALYIQKFLNEIAGVEK